MSKPISPMQMIPPPAIPRAVPMSNPLSASHLLAPNQFVSQAAQPSEPITVDGSNEHGTFTIGKSDRLKRIQAMDEDETY
jgi:hypothetical protein